MNLTPRKLDAIALGSALALTGAAYAMGVHPVVADWGRRHNLEAELSSTRKEQTDLLNARIAAQEAQAKRAGEKSIEFLDARKINLKRRKLGMLASKTEVQVWGTNVGDERTGEGYRTIELEMDGTATLASCLKFLDALNEEHQDIGVRSLYLITPTQDEQNPLFEFDLVWFVLPDGTAS